MAKKIKVILDFNKIELKPDITTLEDAEILDSLQSENPIIRKWTDYEILMGESGKLNHLDHLTLKLGTTKSDILQQSISGWAKFPIGFQKIQGK